MRHSMDELPVAITKMQARTNKHYKHFESLQNVVDSVDLVAAQVSLGDPGFSSMRSCMTKLKVSKLRISVEMD